MRCAKIRLETLNKQDVKKSKYLNYSTKRPTKNRNRQSSGGKTTFIQFIIYSITLFLVWVRFASYNDFSIFHNFFRVSLTFSFYFVIAYRICLWAQDLINVLFLSHFLFCLFPSQCLFTWRIGWNDFLAIK